MHRDLCDVAYVRRAPFVVACVITVLFMGCAPQSAEERLRDSGVAQLTEVELRAAHSGATARGVALEPRAFFYISYSADGRLGGKIGNSLEEALSSQGASDDGTWRIGDGSALCVRWRRWLDHAESCLHVYRSGKKFVAYLPNGRLALSYRVEPGVIPAPSSESPRP